MERRFTFIMYFIAALLFGCNEQTGDYIAASSISANGFARNGAEMRKAHGQEIKIWGFVDHSNIYGNNDVKTILGDWWSGDGPGSTTWRFNLKTGQDDGAGDSFPVHVPNDQGRDELLKVFLIDARANKPTKVFVNGRIFAFDAPANVRRFTGLYMEVQSSHDIVLKSQGRSDR
ncbi:MAG: hypothetical protein WBN95_01355 [Gammaproteobacteria bacterium]